MKANRAMGRGRPSAWPMTWSFWLREKRVKSEMFRAMVAQNPTMAVRPPAITVLCLLGCAPPGPKASGLDSMAPKPPAFCPAHQSSSRPMTIRNGAAQVSSQRIDSVPLAMNHRCRPQKARKHRVWAAPFLIVMGLLLLWWAGQKAGGFGAMLSKPDAFGPGGAHPGKLWTVIAGGLTAMVGFWATMALNISDFTRFSRSQKDQVIGQALGLPLPMALFAFIGVAVTSATVVIYGKAIWDPVELTSKIGGVGVVLALFVLVIATITTNIAANVVSPAYDFSNLAPSKISFRTGGYITAGIGVLMFPWKLLESTGAYLFTWLGGYSALLGPIAGILVADYFLVKKQQLADEDLFRRDGQYAGSGGWNLRGVTALVIGVAPILPGFLLTVGAVASVPPSFDSVFAWAWFVGFLLAGAVFWLLILNRKSA